MSGKQYLISLEKSRSVAALIAGMLIFAGTLLCVFWAIDLHNSGMLKYFTLLSNLLSAVGAAFMIPYAVEGIRKKRFTLLRWVVLFQFAGAVCVTITMVSALGLILPTQGPEKAFYDYNFILHVVTPLATVILFQCVESGVSLDIFTEMSERCGVPLEDLVRAYVRGAADSLAERKVHK